MHIFACTQKACIGEIQALYFNGFNAYPKMVKYLKAAEYLVRNRVR